MKDTRFTELVNLYIDRQISPEEAAELESEIRVNARRRHTYRQYCQMHRATKLVYESFRADADSEAAPARQPGSIAHIQSRRQRQKVQRWALYAGGLAAAACITVVFSRMDFDAGRDAQLPTVLAASPSTVTEPTSIANVPEVISAVPLRSARTGLASLSSGVVNETDYAAAMSVLREEERRLAALEQQSGGPARNRSLFDDGVFDNRTQVMPGQNTRNANSRQRSDRMPVEFTAFQFQR